MITAEKFYQTTLGNSYEMDGVPKSDPIQCADYFKKACLDVLGYHYATGGDGYVDYFWYNRKEHEKEFDFVTDWRQVQPGDFVIWAHSKRSAQTPFPSSHIAMYWEKGGKKYMVGQNQPAKRITEKIEPDDVWARMLGALRFKAWAVKKDVLPYGLTAGKHEGISFTVVKAPKSKGYDLHVVSAPGAYAVQEIDAFDSEKLEILAGVNANYFQISDGRHLGCEGDGTVKGYQQIVPLQTGWAVFFQKDGTTSVWDSTAYYYDQSQVDFVCTPYAVRLFHGQIVFFRSTNCGDKDDTKNTQTAALRFTNGDWAVAIFSECCPRDVCAWALQYEGVEDLILMDSGGSTQMFECTSGTRKIVKKTGRKVANALVLGRKLSDVALPKDEAPEETIIEPIISEEDNPVSDAELIAFYEAEIERIKGENTDLKEEREEIIKTLTALLNGLKGEEK